MHQVDVAIAVRARFGPARLMYTERITNAYRGSDSKYTSGTWLAVSCDVVVTLQRELHARTDVV